MLKSERQHQSFDEIRRLIHLPLREAPFVSFFAQSSYTYVLVYHLHIRLQCMFDSDCEKSHPSRPKLDVKSSKLLGGNIFTSSTIYSYHKW